MADEELKTMVRDFRTSVSTELAGISAEVASISAAVASVSAELDVTNRRLDAFAHEVRNRFATMETAFLNEIRDVSRRLERIERRMGGLQVRVDDLERGSSSE